MKIWKRVDNLISQTNVENFTAINLFQMCASEETKGCCIVLLWTWKNSGQTRPLLKRKIVASSVKLEIIMDKKYKTLRVIFYI